MQTNVSRPETKKFKKRKMHCRHPRCLTLGIGGGNGNELGNSPWRWVFVMRSEPKHVPILAQCDGEWSRSSAPVASNERRVRFVGDWHCSLSRNLLACPLTGPDPCPPGAALRSRPCGNCRKRRWREPYPKPQRVWPGSARLKHH